MIGVGQHEIFIITTPIQLYLGEPRGRDRYFVYYGYSCTVAAELASIELYREPIVLYFTRPHLAQRSLRGRLLARA